MNVILTNIRGQFWLGWAQLQKLLMVRLEKIAYEQIVNSKALGRARVMGAPSKWYGVNPWENNAAIAQLFYHKSLLGRLLWPLMKWFTDFRRNYSRQRLLDQGLTFEDHFLHTDTEMRRSVIWEHIARSNLHPYQWILKSQRRARYYKVERALRGFYVPEYIKNEARSYTWRDLVKVRDEFNSFIYNNYTSELTPSPRKTSLGFYSIDLGLNYGAISTSGWDKYFLNEGSNSAVSNPADKPASFVRDPRKFPYDLTTPEGKRKFEKEVTETNDRFPGLVAPEGEKFDFKKYYGEIGV